MDAAGFWGTQSGSGKIIYHKEPSKSSVLVKKDIWRKTAHLGTNLLLAHARAASHGVGEPAQNKNNHPFVSADRSVGLVHNGRITDAEYQSLKLKYEVLSDCDSEILLRLFEAGEQYGKRAKDDFPDLTFHVSCRFAGLRDIFSFINQGHMAVAIGERHGCDRYLWLFRNVHRSLWVADMRAALGQVFFCSTQEIWHEAVDECESILGVIGRNHKLIEIPPEEIWFFKMTADTPDVGKPQRFDVTRASSVSWNFDGSRMTVGRKRAAAEVISKLNDEESVADERPMDTNELQTWCQRIREKACDIETLAQTLISQGSMSRSDFSNLVERLEQHDGDLRVTMKMLET